MITKAVQAAFSNFTEGYRNRNGKAVPKSWPSGITDCPSVFNRIKSDELKPATLQLRSMDGSSSAQEVKNFKILHFPGVTAAGVFQYRQAARLITPSGLITLDIDGLASTEEARQLMRELINDEWLDIDLGFVSPRGRGVKLFVSIPDYLDGLEYGQVFEFFTKHLSVAHGILIDQSGSDISRLALLAWDPEAYLNPKYLSNNPLNK